MIVGDDRLLEWWLDGEFFAQVDGSGGRVGAGLRAEEGVGRCGGCRRRGGGYGPVTDRGCAKGWKGGEVEVGGYRGEGIGGADCGGGGGFESIQFGMMGMRGTYWEAHSVCRFGEVGLAMRRG